jgi:transcriptional regulator with XRE-family HTH domain
LDDVNILSPGQRLKEIRKSLRLRQDELAGGKFSKNYISMFENNKRSINAINATYLAEQINELAKQRGKDINIKASYLLKSDEDMAKEKCEGWLNEVENNLDLSLNKVYMNLYKAIYVSSKYELLGYKAKALYLKGISSLQCQLYDCAMTQLLDALIYYAQENDFIYVGDIYAKLGMILYNQRNLKQALIYFNLSHSILKNYEDVEDKIIEDLKYHKALCYCEMGQYNTAQNMLGKVTTKNMKLLDLASQINRVLAV